MNKQTRIDKINKLIDSSDPHATQDIPWDDNLKLMEVYCIPLEYLIYNKYNGRILSRTKSYETQYNKIDAESPKGKDLIANFLYKSKPKKNAETLESLKKIGQEKVGIITKDGIIIDGNRRAMLLNRLAPLYDTFKAVILPIEYDGNPLAIEKFETKYQLGEESKLDYNPTEIYLKIQRLYLGISGTKYPTLAKQEQGIAVDKKAITQIFEWIGNYKTISSANDVEYFLRVMNLMDEYLDYLGYDYMYTALDDREEQFRSLTEWLRTFYGENSAKAFDGYSDDDVDDLKLIAFDLIRVKLKNEKFRHLGRGHKSNHFFGNKNTWDSFYKAHFDITENSNEPAINQKSLDIEKHLNDRDNAYSESIGKKLTGNVDQHVTKLRNKQSQDEPVKLLNKAIDSIDSININHNNFAQKDAQDLLANLGNRVFDNMSNKSPSRILDHVVSLLEGIDLDNIPKNELEDVRDMTKKIQQIGYKINKGL